MQMRLSFQAEGHLFLFPSPSHGCRLKLVRETKQQLLVLTEMVRLILLSQIKGQSHERVLGAQYSMWGSCCHCVLCWDVYRHLYETTREGSRISLIVGGFRHLVNIQQFLQVLKDVYGSLDHRPDLADAIPPEVSLTQSKKGCFKSCLASGRNAGLWQIHSDTNA